MSVKFSSGTINSITNKIKKITFEYGVVKRCVAYFLKYLKKKLDNSTKRLKNVNSSNDF